MPRRLLASLLLIVAIAAPACCAQSDSQKALAYAREVYNTKGAREALPEYEKSLALARADGDRLGEAVVFGLMGNCYKKLGDRTRALELLTRALAMKRELGNRSEEGKTLMHLGLLFWETAEYAKAIEHFTRSISIAQEQGDRLLEAAALSDLSLVYDEMGDYRRSLEGNERALAAQQALKSERDIGITLGNIGGTNLLLGRLHEAEKYYRQSLAISERLGSKESIGQDVGNLALCQAGMGKLKESLAGFDRAVELAHDTGNTKEEADWRKGKGSALLQAGQYDAAREQFQLAQNIYEKSGLKRELVEALNDAGTLAASLGDSAAASRDFERALAVARAIGHPRGVVSSLIALADMEWRRGRLDTSSELCEQAVAGARQAGDAGALAAAYLLFSRVHREQKRPDAAFDDAQRALAAGRESGAAPAVAEAQLAAAEARETPAHAEQGLALLQTAAETAREVGDPELQWRIAFARGRTLERVKRDRDAMDSYKSAVAIIETVRARIREDRFRAGYLNDRHHVYSALVRLLMRLGETDEAFSYAERLRARNYLDLLNRRAIPAPDARRQPGEGELRQRILRLQRVIERQAGNAAGARGESLDIYRAELAAAERAYQELIDDVRRDEPVYADALEMRVPSSADVARLLPVSTALIEYIVGDHEVSIFVITPGGLRGFSAPARPENLQSKVELLRELIVRRRSDWKETAESLYRTLIHPAEQSGILKGVRRLFIVPHGVLHYLPFAVLNGGAERGARFLAEDYEIAYLPAAAMLATAAPPNGIQKTMLAVAPSSSRLRFASEEARRVANFFPRRARLLAGSDATESAFKRAAADYGMVHLATHGYFNKFNPLFSGVQLESDREEDGRLNVYEILGMHINASLVTLSACDTAMGSGYLAELPAGDELLGLMRAFLFAGSRSVLASLWEVDDRSTLELMRGFYRRMAAGDDKPAALARTQRQILRGAPRYRHPYYWAPFVLTGQVN